MRASRRKVEQIVPIPAVSGGVGTQDIYALCGDGSIWYCANHPTNSAWVQVDTTTLTKVKEEYDV